MVKVWFLAFFLIFSSFSFAEEEAGVDATTKLHQKIASFLPAEVYNENASFIRVVFEPASEYYTHGRIDVIKVIQRLKENGLLSLFFEKPTTVTLHFKTSGSPVFFVKIMRDALRNMGYFRYITVDSSLDAAAFEWSIALTSEYVTDPLLLQRQLQKNGARVIDIQREAPAEWSYTVDIAHAYLRTQLLEPEQKIELPHSLYAQWLDVSRIKALEITSSSRNRWYPYIAFYDASLHILKLVKEERVTKRLQLAVPSNAKYMKITDLYTLKNIHDALTLEPKEAR